MLGALASLVGAVVTATAQNNAIAAEERMAKKELKFQEEQAKRQEDLQTADRVDALGNRMTYDELTGFETILAPLIQSMVDATAEEQHKSIALDAPRNRAARVRQDERTKLADDAYTKAFEQYNNRTPVDEDRFVADDAIQAALMFGGKGPSVGEQAAMQAVRQGTMVPSIPETGPSDANLFAASLMDAKKSGKARALAEENAAEAVDLSSLAQIMAMANQAPQAQVHYSNMAASERARADNALMALISTIAQNAQVIGGSMDNLTAIAGKTPDYGAIFANVTSGMKGLDSLIQKSVGQKQAQTAAEANAARDYEMWQQGMALDRMKTYDRFSDEMSPNDFMNTLSIF